MKSSEILKTREAEIRAMLAKDITLAAIGKHFGVSQNVARHWKDALGVQRKKASHPKHEATLQFEQNWPSIQKMLAAGYSFRQIAQDLGVTRSRVLGWSKKWPRTAKPSTPTLRPMPQSYRPQPGLYSDEL